MNTLVNVKINDEGIGKSIASGAATGFAAGTVLGD